MKDLARNILRTVVGDIRWEHPSWAKHLGKIIAAGWNYLLADVRRMVAAVALLMGVGVAWYWYAHRPVPHYVEYTVTSPALTEYGDKGISYIAPVLVDFKESAAPLAQVDKDQTRGISMSPRMAGAWRWVTDRQLKFTPKNDWPVDGSFTVSFDKKHFFAPGVELEDYSVDFRSQPFTARVIESQFYQDPRDPNLKKLVATVQFSHPVDTGQFEKRVSLSLAKDAEYQGLRPDSRDFTVVYDKFHLNASVHSAPLAMPRDDTKMSLHIDKGIRAARGGNETRDKLDADVVIPGRSSLRFSGAHMTLVDNAKYEPEQIVLVNSSSPVAEKALTGKVTAWILPIRSPRQPKEDLRPYRWDYENEIGKDILDKSQALGLTYVSSDAPGDTNHGFKFLAPVGRYVFLEVRDGVEGIGGYISGKTYTATFVVEPYRQALTFLGKGSLLSLSGDRKIGFLTRDIDHVEVEIGRVLPNQLQHVAPTMWDYSKPNMYGGLADQVVERFVKVRNYAQKPGKPSYDSIDLGQYLKDQAQRNRGLFLLRIRAVTPKPGKDVGEDGDNSNDDEGAEGYQGAGIEDTRLVLVTDLGFIVKQAKDGTRDVFVQSIHSGQPVEGVRVEAVGRNGIAALAAVTDATGCAHLPKFNGLKREKAPAFILAEKDSDFSFMPLQTQGRALDVSRFDTGGVESAKSSGQLSSYLFTDRGVYRPGETAHIGIVTRTADWKASLTGLPLEIEITDSRGTVVNRSNLKLSSVAFDEVAFASQPASPTGTYEAAAWLVKDEKNREMLGTTSFRVQEFEPDRMKVRLDLSDKPVDGWLRPADVKARVTVAHLFGEPAGNRRVEGEMSLSPVLPRFTRYPEYRFQVGQFLDEPFRENLAATTTDDKGNAELHLDLGRFTGRAYRVNVLARAFEAEGGRNVAAQNSAIVSDAPFLVGIKTDGDLSFVKRGSARQAHWLAVNQQLNPVAAEGLTMDWVQKKYVSVLTQQTNQTYQYVSKLKEIVRDTRKVRIGSGGANFALPTNEPGDFMLVLRDGAGAELNKLNYSVAGEANISRSLDRDAELQIQLDKPGYAAGDTIEVSIRAPYTGAGLITIERDRVYQSQWFKTTTTSSVQHISVPRDFEGNGYVSVQFVRDPSSDEIFLSPLSYGVAGFNANLAARTEGLRVTAPKEIRPGMTLNVRVVPAEPSRVALLAVDEGILQVARYRNPDPLGYFFQKRMLEVDTSQILDLILPEFRKFMELAAPGGDADGGYSRHLNPFNRKRKPPVAYWSGVVDVGTGGHDFRYTVPDYFNGHLRIVAIAVDSKKVGVTETGTDVKGNFILTPNVPAMVAPGDEFLISVGVFNNTTGGSGPIHVEAQPSTAFTNVGPLGVDLTIPDKREGVAEFRFKANAVLGSADIRFVARRGNAEARIEDAVSVRPPGAYRTELTLGRFDGASVTVPLKRDMFNEKRAVKALDAFTPLVWGESLVAWLDDYPYSCTEQLVSKGMSALVVTSRPELGTVRSRDNSGLPGLYSALQSRENEQGGLGLWSSSPQTAEYPTIYAVQLLLEARDRGQRIPAPLVATLNDWMMRYASTPAPTLADARWRAYAVYLLARQGLRVNNPLSNVEQELTHRYPQEWQTDIAAGWLAATYRLMQRNSDAERIAAKVPFSRQKKNWNESLYYDSLTHDSELLYVIAHHFPARLGSIPSSVLEDMAASINGGQENSLSAAWTLLALDAYSKAAGTRAKLTIAAIGRDGQQHPLTNGDVPVNSAKVLFGKEGALAAYFSISESGFDHNPPTAALSQGIEIIHEFLDMKGNPITQVKVGEEFLARVRLRATNRGYVPQVAVVDMPPGGTEPVIELRPTADSSTPEQDPATTKQSFSPLPIGITEKSNWTPQHIDVRDDRVVLYGDIGKDAGTFVYRLRATNAGTFEAPPAFAEGMYDRKVSGYGIAGKLEIVKP